MQEIAQREAADKSREPVSPDLGGIIKMERWQDQLGALENIFQAALEQEHRLSPEEVEEIYALLENQAAFQASHGALPPLPITSELEVQVRQQRDEFGRLARETTAKYFKIYKLDQLTSWEPLPRVIFDEAYYYGSDGPSSDLVRSTLAELSIHGPKRTREMQDVSTHWEEAWKDVSGGWQYSTTHEILVRYANGLPEGAHASVYNTVGVEYSATADFADGQIAKICLSDLKGMELTFARTKGYG